MPLTLLLFHHFHSTRKLSALHALTHALARCSGLYLLGRPGALLVSSPDPPQLHEYVRSVKRMRWQHVRDLGTADLVLRDVPLGELWAAKGRVAGLAAAAGACGGEGVEAWVRAAVSGRGRGEGEGEGRGQA